MAIDRYKCSICSIDIRSTKDLTLIKNFPTHLSFLREFNKTSEYYLFGCGNGILITDYAYNKVSVIKIESEVDGIVPVSESLVVLSKNDTLKLLDLSKMKIVQDKVLKELNDGCIRNLNKTSISDEVAICTNSTGVWFAQVKSWFFSLNFNLSEEVYYRSLSISAIKEVDSDRIAVLPEYKNFIGIVSRSQKKELFQIKVQEFSGWFYCSCVMLQMD